MSGQVGQNEISSAGSNGGACWNTCGHLLRKVTRDSAALYSEARIQNKAKLHYRSGVRYLAFLAFFSFFSFFAFFAALPSSSPASSAFLFFSFFSCSYQGRQFR